MCTDVPPKLRPISLTSLCDGPDAPIFCSVLVPKYWCRRFTPAPFCKGLPRVSVPTLYAGTWEPAQPGTCGADLFHRLHRLHDRLRLLLRRFGRSALEVLLLWENLDPTKRQNRTHWCQILGPGALPWIRVSRIYLDIIGRRFTPADWGNTT